MNTWWVQTGIGIVLIGALAPWAAARQNIRDAFFSAYPGAVGSRIDLRLDQTEHCGVCHYDFNGAGPRNPYGQAVEAALPNYPSNPSGRRQAVESVQNLDPEGDGFTALIEVTDTTTYGNTPTFPGLSAANVGQVTNIALSEIEDYLTPALAGDTTPPTVQVLYPAGGESLASSSAQIIAWAASDNSGVVVAVDVLVSFDGGTTFSPLALGIANSGELDWFVQNRPSPDARIRVVAVDPSNNSGGDDSGAFSIYSSATGRVPTTLRDFDMPGSQPLDVSPLNSPTVCAACHGGYDPAVEPQHTWAGSAMAHASIDPIALAAFEVANADAPESGDLCLRCHTSAGWLGGRSTPTDGSAMLASDLTGVNCDLCHRMVDPFYETGVNPPEDAAILAALAGPPQDFTLGQFVVDPSGTRRRGPFSDTVAPHGVLVSPFHREAALCGTCHDVSNPVFVRNPDGSYTPNAFDQASAEFGPHEIGVVERTYSEWFHSEYNTPAGVYAPQFGGNREYVAACQDCHMRAVTGKGCNDPSAPTRTDLPLHDLTGGSTWMLSILPQIDPSVDVDALNDGIARARELLQRAATLELEQHGRYFDVIVTNHSGHKLPTGYPEGRRMWLNVRFYDASDTLIGESGVYDAGTGELHHDATLRVYETLPVIGENIAPVVGLPAYTEFHFVLNNKVLKDNRIPPLGFTNAAYDSFGGKPVGASYADGQNWDIARYEVPPAARRAEVVLYYQSLSKEFVEFLRDNGAPGGAGETLYDLWVSNDRCPPEPMVSAMLTLVPYSRLSGSAAPGGDAQPLDPQVP